jgi:signal transduction histidine kinase/GGDEF domain-containing protein
MGSRILVVDDEKEIRDFLLKALTRLKGYDVELAESGEEALKKIEKGNFDLVLTDLKMPNTDGLQLVTEIGKSKPEILTVLMTGHGTIDSALEAMKRGASDYLTKPLNLDEMIVRLQKVLEERQRFVKLRDFATQLEKANQELKRIDEMKSEFVSVASHELRTPLAAIKNAVQLILQGKTGEINENQKNFLSMAERNISRLTNILNNLLDLSRIESGKIDLKIEELDPRTPIEFILSSLKPQADGKSIQLRIEIQKELPTVYGDREKVEQILTNLVGNAIKFTPEGGEITVSARPSPRGKNKLAISVRDSGIGISEDQFEKIFEKFHQVEGSLHRSVSGTGLGLAITKGLVEAQHGEIWVESQVGKGSTFTFTLSISEGERRDLHFRFILDREFQRVQETQSSLTLFLVEIKDQKDEVKDILINKLEESLKKCLCRRADIVLRRKREKLLAALCEADLKAAGIIRLRVEQALQNNPDVSVVSPLVIRVGMATYPEEAVSKRELFRLAKERLGG